MASVVVNGDTSGAVTLSAPAVAGTVTVTLPSTSGVMAVGGGTITTLTTTSDITVQGVTVGRGAGAVATNTAVGASALAANTSGAANAVFGYDALKANTTGYDSVAVGHSALLVATTATNNTAVGRAALAANTTASNNTGLGYVSLASNTTGASNTAVGANALQANTTASKSVAVGYQAGYTTYNGDGQTLVGYQAGYALTNGSYVSTFIGYQAGIAMTSGNKNTIIGSYSGNQGGLDIRTASNYIVLSDGDGNPRGYFDDAGQFWVKNSGASAVCFKGYATSASFGGIVVDVFADRNTTNSSFAAYRYYNVGAGAVKFIVQDSGNVQNTNNSYGATSDIKLKENIVDASPKLEDLCKVKIRQYNLKSDPTHKQIGVIAQELEEVFAGMVEESADRDAEGNDLGTKTKAVKYSVFVPMLIKAIQELKAEVDSLKAQINGASA